MAISTVESSKQFFRYQLTGPGGLFDMLNFGLTFLGNLLQKVPMLLVGVPLGIRFEFNRITFRKLENNLFYFPILADNILIGLPNFIGTFENILPNLRFGRGGLQYECNDRRAPLIDIHDNEINLVKISFG